MPELPDIAAYIEALKPRVKGRRLRAIRIASPLLLRTVEPAPEACCDKQVQRFRRLGKRIAIGLEDDYWLVLHLMIAGRLHWRDQPAAKLPGKRGLAAFDFPDGTLLLTEAGSKRRASLHLTRGSDTLDALHRGGLEVLEASPAEFGDAMRRRNRTVKRALTDPSICSGIGNAYSDEILHRARLSPVALTGSLDEAEIQRLFAAARARAQRVDRAALRRGRASAFPRGSPHFATAWRSTEGIASLVPTAALQSSVYATRPTRPTTAPAARRMASCSRTARCRACCAATGRAPSTSCPTREAASRGSGIRWEQWRFRNSFASARS